VLQAIISTIQLVDYYPRFFSEEAQKVTAMQGYSRTPLYWSEGALDVRPLFFFLFYI